MVQQLRMTRRVAKYVLLADLVLKVQVNVVDATKERMLKLLIAILVTRNLIVVLLVTSVH